MTESESTEVKPLQLICHAALIFTFGASSYLTVIFGPRQRGFFCGDESIHYPFHYSTIPMAVLHIAFYVLLIPTIICVEYYCSRYIYPFYQSKLPKNYECCGYRIGAGLIRGIQFFLISQLGFMIDIFFLNITKYSVGRLRPHFLAVCRPSVNVSTVDACGGATTYIEHYICLGKDAAKITDARLSFYSGHTSHSFYWAVFISLYLYSRITRRHKASVGSILVYALLIAIAAFIGYSRVFDNKHHPSDVAVGAAVGAGIAALMFVIFRHLFFDIVFVNGDRSSSSSALAKDAESNRFESVSTNVTPIVASSVGNQSIDAVSDDEDNVEHQHHDTVTKKNIERSKNEQQLRPQVVQIRQTSSNNDKSSLRSVTHNPESHV